MVEIIKKDLGVNGLTKDKDYDTTLLVGTNWFRTKYCE